MTKGQRQKLERFRRLSEVFGRNGLPVATHPPMARGVKWFQGALKALEEVSVRALPEDATAWEREDHALLLRAAFDAVGCAVKEGIEPHLEFYAMTAPAFFGVVRGALVARAG